MEQIGGEKETAGQTKYHFEHLTMMFATGNVITRRVFYQNIVCSACIVLSMKQILGASW